MTDEGIKVSSRPESNTQKKEEPKRLLRGTIFLSAVPFVALNMTMKEKVAPLCQRGAIFKKRPP